MSEKYLQSSLLMDMAKYIYAVVLLFRKLNKDRPVSFAFGGLTYSYFEHPYNGTWMNERAVEIPLAWSEIQKHPPERVLEVGNVLSHYFNVKHTVVDKYENKLGVISEDIMEVNLNKRYDCIVSISTIEHVGWDEIPQSPEKSITAIEKMRQMLAENGTLFITIPLGYNPALDKSLFDGMLECNNIFYYQRLNRYEWRQTTREQVLGSTYGQEYRSTNGLAVCVWNKG